MSIEAMKQAIDFVEYCLEELDLSYMASNQAKRLIEKSRQAIADAEKQEQGEPVAWFGADIEGNPNKFRLNKFSGAIPLYAQPQPWTDDLALIAYLDGIQEGKKKQQQRKPLTDEQIYAIGKQLGMQCRLGGNPNIDIEYARAIEAAHGIIKNYPEKDKT